ncbi:MAG: hypothetical protein ACXAE3_11795 [Candidatus Kariarchaeaceae archaeon]
MKLGEMVSKNPYRFSHWDSIKESGNRITHLGLSQLNPEHLPKELINLTELRVLDLTGPGRVTLPPGLGELQQLSLLILPHNGGDLPATIQSLETQLVSGELEIRLASSDYTSSVLSATEIASLLAIAKSDGLVSEFLKIGEQGQFIRIYSS